MNGKNLKKRLVFGLLLALSAAAWGNDAVDVYIIVDSSAAMERGGEEALAWLCGRIDGFRQGDRLWMWRAGEKAELVYSDTLGADREEIKSLVRSTRFEGETADYVGALREAQVISGRNAGRLAYALLVSGAGAKSPGETDESAGPLRYSRVESFSGWRVFTVGLDLGSRVRRSSSYYMNNR